MAYSIIKQFYAGKNLVEHIIDTYDTREAAENRLKTINAMDPYQTKYAFIVKERKERGMCSLCRCIVYADDSGAVTLNGYLFCSQSCADETEFILDDGEIRAV